MAANIPILMDAQLQVLTHFVSLPSVTEILKFQIRTS